MLTFSYVYQGTQGLVHAVSVAQAVDRVKVAYLAHHGVKPADPRFRLNKKNLVEPRRLNLAPETNIRFRSLYRQRKDGEPLSPSDIEFHNKYSQAVKDLNSLCPSHLRPIGVTT